MGIYDEVIKSGNDASKDKSGEESRPIDEIIYIDCDREFTLMDLIKNVRWKIDIFPETNSEDINIYIVKGTFTKSNFLWYKFWQYLKETNRRYNIVFRGIFPDGAETVSTYGDNIRVFISKDIEYRNPPFDKIQALFIKNNYKFTEV